MLSRLRLAWTDWHLYYWTKLLTRYCDTLCLCFCVSMTSVTRRQTGRIGIGRDYCRCQQHKPGLWQRDQFSHHLFVPPELKVFYLLISFFHFQGLELQHFIQMSRFWIWYFFHFGIPSPSIPTSRIIFKISYHIHILQGVQNKFSKFNLPLWRANIYIFLGRVWTSWTPLVVQNSGPAGSNWPLDNINPQEIPEE